MKITNLELNWCSGVLDDGTPFECDFYYNGEDVEIESVYPEDIVVGNIYTQLAGPNAHLLHQLFEENQEEYTREDYKTDLADNLRDER